MLMYIYHSNSIFHQYQLDKINLLEEKHKKREKELDALRAKTKQCPIPNLKDPRSCYLKSNYQCSWNDEIDRCDLIE